MVNAFRVQTDLVLGGVLQVNAYLWFEVDYHFNSPVSVLCSTPDQLDQVTVNLLRNPRARARLDIRKPGPWNDLKFIDVKAGDVAWLRSNFIRRYGAQGLDKTHVIEMSPLY